MQTHTLILALLVGFCTLTSCVLYTAYSKTSGRLHTAGQQERASEVRG